MTLVKLGTALKKAQKGRYAVGAFNINNLEFVQSVIRAGEKLKSPLIISTTEGAIKYAGMEYLCDIILPAARRAKVPIVFHLDHGRDLKVIRQAITSGYTSVMYDGSHLSLAENIRNTARVVKMAHKHGVHVEGELGTIGGAEDLVSSRTIIYTEPEDARMFVKKTGVDALAVAIGTSHGAYKFSGKQSLDITRLKDICGLVRVPLVLHGASEVPKYLVNMCNRYGSKIKGASGVPDTQIKKAVKHGICKVNEDTDLRLAWLASVRRTLHKDPTLFDPRKILGPSRDFVQKIVEDRIKILGSAGRV